MGENQAKTHLLNKGWTFLFQNYYTRFGEIDLIFLDGDTVVFVEVKARKNDRLGHPEEAITKAKLQHLQKAAEIFLTKNTKWQEKPLRIDMIAIEGNIFRHYPGIS